MRGGCSFGSKSSNDGPPLGEGAASRVPANSTPTLRASAGKLIAATRRPAKARPVLFGRVTERSRQHRCRNCDPRRADNRRHRDEDVDDGVFGGAGGECRSDAPTIGRRGGIEREDGGQSSEGRRLGVELDAVAAEIESPSNDCSVDSSLMARRRRNSSCCQVVPRSDLPERSS